MAFRYLVITRIMPALLGVALAACSQAASTTPAPQEEPLPTVTEATLTAGLPLATPTQPTEILAPSATATNTATFTPTSTHTPSPTSPPFNVTGKVCYPSENIPPMTAFFENTDSEALVELPIAAGQASYEVKLPAGTYIAYAWLEDFSRGGLYSRAVPCGLQTGCDDHTLLTFTAVETQVLQDIDLCDWYAGPFNVPYPPGRQPDEVTGVISGSIVYPGDSAPKMRVVASNTQTEYWYWVYTESSQGFYAIDDLPPGQYYIVAYLDDGQAGAHATPDHDLIAVTVESGVVTEGVTINDWDAPAGTFPPDPTR